MAMGYIFWEIGTIGIDWTDSFLVQRILSALFLNFIDHRTGYSIPHCLSISVSVEIYLFSSLSDFHFPYFFLPFSPSSQFVDTT